MSELRQRKPDSAPAPAAPKVEEREKSKTKAKPQEPDLEPNIFVLSAMFVVFTVVVGSFLFYKVDSAQNGPFAAYVNEKFPVIDKLLNQPGQFPSFGANAEEITVPSNLKKFTEEELKAYDGTDADKPIYLAINGTVYDVSAAPSFYGPGGPYHHFVGKDASRAWVSECWASEDQFTWRMDGVEEMFLPKYLDEILEDVNQGKTNPDADSAGFVMPKEAMQMMAKKSMERFGSVTDGEKARRREEGKEEAATAVHEALSKWVSFFAKNDKYQAVGEVSFDESRPAPPALCEEAIKKRPIKGGKLAGLMSDMNNIGKFAPKADGEEDAEEDDGFPAGMPESVKEQIKKDRAAKAAAESVEEVDLSKDEEEKSHDEL